MKTLSPQQQVAMTGHKAKMREQLAVEAGRVMAEQNPTQFKADLEGGFAKDYLSPKSRELLSGYADHQMKVHKIKAAGVSSGTVADWAGAGPQRCQWAGRDVDPRWTGDDPENDPNVEPKDKEDAMYAGAIGSSIGLWKKQNFNTRHPAPKSNIGDEYLLSQKIKAGTATIRDVGDMMKLYGQDQGCARHRRRNRRCVCRKSMHPDKVQKYSAVHNDPELKSVREKAEEYIVGQAGLVVKGLGTGPAGQAAAKGDFSGGVNNPATKQKIREFRLYVDKTLHGAVDRGERWQDYA